MPDDSANEVSFEALQNVEPELTYSELKNVQPESLVEMNLEGQFQTSVDISVPGLCGEGPNQLLNNLNLVTLSPSTSAQVSGNNFSFFIALYSLSNLVQIIRYIQM